MHNLHVAYIQCMLNLGLTYKNVQTCGTSSPYDNVYHRTVACSLRIENVSLTYATYTNVLAEFRIRSHTLVLTYLNVCITYLLRTSNLCLTYKQYVGIRWRFFMQAQNFWISSPYDNVYQRTVACSQHV